jgi:hypothetical protein
LIEGIHDPIFRDICLRILASLLLGVTLWMVGTHYVENEVGSQPEVSLRTRVFLSQRRQKIRLTKLPWPNL